MKKNVLVAQSGGPTVAINASLAGVISACLQNPSIGTIYGGKNGIEGILKKHLIPLNSIFQDHNDNIEKLMQTPSMYLGSCRYKMKDLLDDSSDYEALCTIFTKYHIDYFFYIGGNDSMDTVLKLSRFVKEKNLDLKVVGIPKTIDNDLTCIDHTPGFGSAAKYIATSILEMAHDTYIYDTKTVLIVEIMGRNAGWLTAASVLARTEYSAAPHLIYLPEIPFDREEFISSVHRELQDKNYVIIAVSEGIKDKNGEYISASSSSVDQFGHQMLSGTGEALKQMIQSSIGCKVRNVELNVLQRAAAHLSSKTDLLEAKKLGEHAVKLALEGKTGVMSVIKRISNEPYQVAYSYEDISKIANKEKTVPLAWIKKSGNDVNYEMVTYLRPLISGHMKLKMQNDMPEYLYLA